MSEADLAARWKLGVVLGLATLGAGLAAVTRAADDGEKPSAPAPIVSDSTATDDTVPAPQDAAAEVTDAPPRLPPPLRHPQPSLRHATPRYEATYAVSPADAALVRRLEEPLPEGGIRLPENATLLDLEDWLSQKANLQVRIDWRALEDSGLDAETPLETHQVEGGGLITDCP